MGDTEPTLFDDIITAIVSAFVTALLAISEGAEFAFGAMGDTNSTLVDSEIITAFVSAFASDAFGFLVDSHVNIISVLVDSRSRVVPVVGVWCAVVE